MTIGWVGQYLRSFADFRRVANFSVQLRAPVYVDDVSSSAATSSKLMPTARPDVSSSRRRFPPWWSWQRQRHESTDNERKQPESDIDQ